MPRVSMLSADHPSGKVVASNPAFSLNMVQRLDSQDAQVLLEAGYGLCAMLGDNGMWHILQRDH